MVLPSNVKLLNNMVSTWSISKDETAYYNTDDNSNIDHHGILMTKLAYHGVDGKASKWYNVCYKQKTVTIES
jgi:hypothetical protein